jgi:hypothetical protein
MTKAKKAQKTDWYRCHPMPKEHVVLSFQHEFSLKDYEKLQQGVIPEQMEDKWFIYFEDNKLHCHRSWTGNCLYVVEFESNGKSGNIVNLTVNRDKKQYTEVDNNWDCQFVVYLINLMLLGKHTPYPEKSGVNPDISAVQQWSQVGRAMLGEATEESC